MSDTPKKLSSNPELVRVFHVNADERLTFIVESSVVWSSIRGALIELEASKRRAVVSHGIGKPSASPRLFIAWVRYEDLEKEKKTPFRWLLNRGTKIDRRVDDEEMSVLLMELALGGI